MNGFGFGFGRIWSHAFHSTPITCAKHSKKRLEHMLRNVPPYPYPVKHTFKQSWFGLYGGKHIQFGNNVPESEYKTRRYWLPNVRSKKLYSRALNQWVELDITTNVLRTIDKLGGLDNYLLGTKTARLKELGPTGWKLRWRILNAPATQARHEAERKALGLPPADIPKTKSISKEQIVKGAVEETAIEEQISSATVTADEPGTLKL
ncbi:hypothetical protein EDC01DRAFT_648659 [Geopyxis carbonaria]|nr:hypothetical protein EDC01DRAFT_648659 [Geopyxis carbonaria]